jgi:uncharacterized protein (TIGR03437 family)
MTPLRPFILSYLRVSEHGTPGALISVMALADQIHILTSCDVMVAGTQAGPSYTGLPCAPIVTHADGSMVSATAPAKAGEVVVAYAVGLGQTNPPSLTGQPATSAAPTAGQILLDFNYRPNALASKPLPSSQGPLYAGVTPTSVGLYQINFRIPPVPADTPACADVSLKPLGANAVQSNLTVSFGGANSFDGAGICVALE